MHTQITVGEPVCEPCCFEVEINQRLEGTSPNKAQAFVMQDEEECFGFPLSYLVYDDIHILV